MVSPNEMYGGGNNDLYGDKAKAGNTFWIDPSSAGTLQSQYDWLASSDRDTAMGAAVSVTSERVLHRTAGVYSDDLTLDTAYVRLQDDAGVIDTGTIVFTERYTTPDPLTVKQRPKNRQVPPSFIDPGNSVTDWYTTPNITESLVTTGDYIGADQKAVKLAFAGLTTGVNICYSDVHTTPFSIKNSTITIRYYMDTAVMDWVGGTTYPSSFRLVFSSVEYADSTLTIYFNKADMSLPLSPGWHEVDICPSNLMMGTGFNAHHVEAWGFYYDAKTGHGDFDIYFDRLTVTPNRRNKAAVVLTFDDAYNTHYTIAAKYMAKYGLRGTLYLEPNSIGVGSGITGRMSVAQAKEMRDKYGWHIASHFSGTYWDYINDPATETSEAQVRQWARLIKGRMHDLGFGEGSDYLALPGGVSYLQSEAHLRILRDYFVNLRSTNPWWQHGKRVFAAAQQITAVADDGASHPRFTCAGHGYEVGHTVYIAGTTNYNGARTVAVVDTNTFDVTMTYTAEAMTATAFVMPAPGANTEPAIRNVEAQAWNPLQNWWRSATQIATGDIAADLAEVVKQKDTLIFFYHAIGASPGDITDAYFKTLIDAIAAYVATDDIEVLTMQELIESETPTQPYTAQTEEWIDVPAIDDDKIVTAIDVALGAQSVADQPDVPRTLIATFTDANSSCTGRWYVYIVGVAANGEAVEEYLHFYSAGGTSAVETKAAFAKVTSVTVAGAVTGAAAGDTLKVGTGDTLGLVHPITQTGDVYKYAEDEADTTVPTIDPINSTIDLTTATNAAHDYKVWYRSRM